MRRAVFIPSASTHVPMFASVIEALRGKEGVESVVLSLESYLGPDAAATALAPLAQAMILLPPPFRAAVPLVQMNFVRRALGRLKFRLGLPKLFSNWRPSVVVLGNDFCPLEYAVVRYARHAGIPSLLVQDGILTWRPDEELDRQMRIPPMTPARAVVQALRLAARAVGLDLAPPFELEYGTAGCTRIAVSGDATRAVLRARDVPNEAIVTTGQPRYDDLIKHPPCRTAARAKLGMSQGQTLVLFAAQSMARTVGGMAQRDLLYEQVLAALMSLPRELTVILRPHPRDDVDITGYEKQIETIGQELGLDHERLPRVVGDATLSAWEALAACNVVVSFTSSLFFEALVLHKPIVVLDLLPRSGRHPLAEAGQMVASLADIPAAIKAALADPPSPEAAARLLESELYRLDGRSGERVAEVIWMMSENQ